MSLEETISDSNLIVLALPSSVVISVFEDLIEYLSDDQVLLDLAKGLAPDDRLISETIDEKLRLAGLQKLVSALRWAPQYSNRVSEGCLHFGFSHKFRL